MIQRLPCQIVLALLTAMPAAADIAVPNESVDHALTVPRVQRSLLAATIVDVVVDRSSFPTEESLKIEVDEVLLDRGWNRPRRSVLGISHLIWPEDLLPKEPGQKVLLVVQPDFSERGDPYLATVLPRADDHLGAVADEHEALRLVEAELLGQLSDDLSDRRLTALIQALRPVLSPAHVDRLRPFLDRPNATVRRAALGAAMTARPNADTARDIGEDLRRFFRRGDGKACASVPERCVSLLETLFESYPYLEPRARRWGSRWSEEEAEAYDRIFEMIRTHSRLSPAVLKLFASADSTPAPSS